MSPAGDDSWVVIVGPVSSSAIWVDDDAEDRIAVVVHMSLIVEFDDDTGGFHGSTAGNTEFEFEYDADESCDMFWVP